MGKFEIKTDKAGKFRFNLKAANGQVILSSQGYESMANCEKGIASVKNNSKEDARFARKESKKGEPYFDLMATNGQVIGTSEMYSGVSAMENGIESVKKNAPDAPIEVLSS